jgi:hypothetical protein
VRELRGGLFGGCSFWSREGLAKAGEGWCVRLEDTGLGWRKIFGLGLVNKKVWFEGFGELTMTGRGHHTKSLAILTVFSSTSSC